MEGPRTLRVEERTALEVFVDNVFYPGRPGAMYGYFPSFFGVGNLENHFIHVDEGRVISHGGMLPRWASLGGCTVRVGEVGAVATDPAYRGRNLGWQVMEATYEKARQDGVDFMLISGGRSIYLSAGARSVGHDYSAKIDGRNTMNLNDPAVTVLPFQSDYLPDCRLAYDRKYARFIRPLDDWNTFITTGTACCQQSKLWIICKNNQFAGYYVVGAPRDTGNVEILEFAGDESVLASALGALESQYPGATFSLHLQQENTHIKAALESAGVAFTPRNADGTILILLFEQFMRRLHPLFETHIGVEAARQLRFEERNNAFCFSDGRETIMTDRAGAAELIFGKEGSVPAPGLLGRIFPVPTLVYGLNFI